MNAKACRHGRSLTFRIETAKSMVSSLGLSLTPNWQARSFVQCSCFEPAETFCQSARTSMQFRIRCASSPIHSPMVRRNSWSGQRGTQAPIVSAVVSGRPATGSIRMSRDRPAGPFDELESTLPISDVVHACQPAPSGPGASSRSRRDTRHLPSPRRQGLLPAEALPTSFYPAYYPYPHRQRAQARR